MCQYPSKCPDYATTRLRFIDIINISVDDEFLDRLYVPVFIDGTGIEVDGAYFEGAGKLYDGSLGYWLHAAFVGGLWVTQRFQRENQGHIPFSQKNPMKMAIATPTATLLSHCAHCVCLHCSTDCEELDSGVSYQLH